MSRSLIRFAYALYKKGLEPAFLTGKGLRRPSSALATHQKEVNHIDLGSIQEIAHQVCKNDDYPWTPEFMGRAQEDSTIAALKKLLLDKRAGGSPGEGDILKGLPIHCVNRSYAKVHL